MNIKITVQDFDGQLEWAIDINGVLWASGDCVNEADGQRQARAELSKAGII